MPRFRIECELNYQIASSPADLIFNIEAARSPGQNILSESLIVNVSGEPKRYVDPNTGNRFAQFQGEPGPFQITYAAHVETIPYVPTGDERESVISELPLDVFPYIFPSRYCESDKLLGLSNRLFGSMPPGYSRVRKIIEWTRESVLYQIGSSTATTTSCDVLLNRVGVCRDFAHVCIALCRALNIPARFVTGYTRFEDPPPDFHAIFEVWLGGRWILFDPTQLAPEADFIRIGTGRDAAEVAFATLFGSIVMDNWRPDVFALEESADTRALIA